MRNGSFGLLLLALTLGSYGCGSGSADDADAGLDELGYVLVESITPDHGPLAGGNVVTVKGAGFTFLGSAPNKFVLGERLAEFVSVIDDRTIEVIVPPGTSPGSVGITVLNQNGSAALANVYSYNEQPTLASVSPALGDRKGGESITVSGTGFLELEAGKNTVFFGAEEAEIVSVDSDTEMVVSAPPGPAPLFVDVQLSNANGSAQLDKEYRYTSATGLLAFGHGPDCNSCGGFPGAAAAAQVEADPGGAYFFDPETQVTEEIPGFLDTEGVEVTIRSAAADADNIYVATKSNGIFQRSLSLGTTKHIATISGCSGNGAFEGMAVHQGSLFATCRNAPQGKGLGVIDLASATFTPVGTFDGCCQSNLASNGTDLFLVRGGQVSKVNTLDGSLSGTVSMTNINSAIRGATFLDGTLFINQFQNFTGSSRVFRVNTTTGETSPAGSLGSSFHGLTAVP